MEFSRFTIPLQTVEDEITLEYGVRLLVLRTDLNHPHISGNKLFKLKYNLLEARKQNYKTLLSFGGAFSNHIAALAAAGKEYGFATVGIIRGDELPELNPTLQFAQEQGMKLRYVSRTLYRNKEELYQYVQEKFKSENFYLIPEGGSNNLGVLGCKEITSYITERFDYVCCACGTGATFAGIVQSLEGKQKAVGFVVLKGFFSSEFEVRSSKTEVLSSKFLVPSSELEEHETKNNKLRTTNNQQLTTNYHFGGYAKIKPPLIAFIREFEARHGIPLDYVYTGKMMYGIYDLIRKGYFEKGTTIVAVHTGGLQGNKGFANSLRTLR